MFFQAQPAASCESTALRAMFEARKRVFIDLHKWDVPALAGRYEIDQYDTVDATYIVLTDSASRHLASTRLLRTDQPHMLGEIFPGLCDGLEPTGPTVREITRFCLEPTLSGADQRWIRNQLVSALVDLALQSGITDYTGAASPAWFAEAEHFGWDCTILGPVREIHGEQLVAVRVIIDRDTPAHLSETGIYSPPTSGVTTAGGLH